MKKRAILRSSKFQPTKVFISLLILVFFTFQASAQVVQIGTGATSAGYPTYSGWKYGWHDAIYTSDEIGEAKDITKIAFDCTNGPKNNTNQKIYMKHTSEDIFTSAGYEDPTNNGYTLVYDGDINFEGWTEVILSTPFSYNGTDNLIIHYENHHGTANYANFNSTESSTNNNKVKGADDVFPTIGDGYLNAYPSVRPNVKLFYATSGPTPATNAIPEENATKIIVDTKLKFTLDVTTSEYKVYFSKNKEKVDNSDISVLITTVSISNTAGDYIVDLETLNSSLLDSKTEYFWKVVTSDGTNETSTTTLPFTTQKVISSFPYIQDFEDDDEDRVFYQGWGTQFTDWEWSNLSWNSSSSVSANNSDSSAYISVASYHNNGESYYLKTPRFNLSDKNYYISFYWQNATIAEDAKLSDSDSTFFEISVNNGEDWTILRTLSPEEAMTEMQLETVDLSTYSSDNVNFRWRYKLISNAFVPKNTYVDYIKIAENTATPTISLDTDNYSFMELYKGGKTTYKLAITNASAASNLVITGTETTGSYSCEYNNSIAPGKTDTAIITFTASEIGTQAGTIKFIIDGDFTGDNTINLTGEVLENNETIFEFFDASLELPEHWNIIRNKEDQFHNVFVQAGSTYEFNTPPNIMRLYNNNDSLSPLMAIMPGVKNFADNHLTFYACKNSPEERKLLVGLMDDPQDPESFELVKEIILKNNATLDTVVFSADNRKPYIVFKHESTYKMSSVRMDDIKWKPKVSTTPPNTAIILNPLNEATDVDIYSGVFLKWSSGGGEPTGYKISIGTTEAANDLIDNQDLSDTTKYKIETELEYNKTYYWKVAPYNDNGSATGNETWSFTTMADPTISTFPWEEGFENPTIHEFVRFKFKYPLGWSMINGGAIYQGWNIITNHATSQNSHTGDNAMHMSFSMSPLDDWLITPPLSLEAGKTYRFSFWYRASIMEESSEKLEVLFGTDKTQESLSKTIFREENINNTTYQKFSIDLNITETENYFFGFHSFSDAAQFITHLDDVKIEEVDNSKITDNSSLKMINLYPNPTTDVIYIKGAKNTDYYISNISGQVLKRGIITDNKIKINISNLKQGIYFINLISGNTSETKKLIIK